MSKPVIGRKNNVNKREFATVISVIVIIVATANILNSMFTPKNVDELSTDQKVISIENMHDISDTIGINVEQMIEVHKPKQEEIKEKTYTDEDVKLLGDLMYAEEGVLFQKVSYEEAKLAHMLAGSVVINRKEHERFEGDSIKEIIYTEGQYATSTLERLGNIDTAEEIYEWAEELLRDGPKGPTNLVWQAEFKQGPIYEKIYNQYFCLLEE